MTTHSYTIHTLELGPMENFIYLIEDHTSQRIAVVDPAWDVDAILAKEQSIGATITDVLLTHSHHDHINGLQAVCDQRNVQVHISAAEAGFWDAVPHDATQHVHGDVLELGDTRIEWLHTPGHTPGSACLRIGDDLIAGDTLFVYGCGRCDLKGGDPAQMFETLAWLKTTLPDQVRIYPGHNYSHWETSSMAEQRAGNPFMHWDQVEAFTRYRMEIHDKIRNTPYEPVTREQLGLA
jgi:glyoxylase-like metal-dependent hydrolase (beta-lactamase superfamily II)